MASLSPRSHSSPFRLRHAEVSGINKKSRKLICERLYPLFASHSDGCSISPFAGLSSSHSTGAHRRMVLDMPRKTGICIPSTSIFTPVTCASPTTSSTGNISTGRISAGRSPAPGRNSAMPEFSALVRFKCAFPDFAPATAWCKVTLSIWFKSSVFFMTSIKCAYGSKECTIRAFMMAAK